MRDYLHANVNILFYIMFCIINTMKKQTILCHFPSSDTKKVPIWSCPIPLLPQSTICSYASDLYGDFCSTFAGILADGMKSVPVLYKHNIFL